MQRKQQKTKGERRRWTLRLEAEVARRLRLKAARDDSTPTHVIEALTYELLDSSGQLIDRRKGAAA